MWTWGGKRGSGYVTKENGVLGEPVAVTGNTMPRGQGGLPRATSLLVVCLIIKTAPVVWGV